MDAILQKYILDSSIPIEKRRNMATDLDNRSIDEATAKGIVLQKYGNKYQGPQGLASSVTQSLSKMTGGGDIATPSAPSSPEISGGWNTRNTLPENAAPVAPQPTQLQHATNPNPTAYEKQFGGRKNGVGDGGFMNSPIGRFAQAQGPMLQEAMDKEKSTGIIERAGNVLGQFGTGVANIAGGFGDVVYGGTGLNYLNPLDKRSGQEKSEQAIGGLNKLVSGVGETVSSPLAASPVLQKGFSLPFEAMKSTIDDNILAAAGIDKNTEHGQNVSNSIMNAITLALVGPKNIAEGATGFIDKTKGVIDKVQNIGNTPEGQVARYQRQIDKTIGQIAQGKNVDIPVVKRALGEVPVKGVKGYSDLAKTMGSKIDAFKKAVDTRLQEHGITYKLSDFDKEVKSGNTTITTNYVKDALDQLQELYQKTNDPENLVRITELANQAQKHTLSLLDVNNIAREYGSEFGKKAFDKKGDALTSVNAQAYENVRSGVKKTVRQEMTDTQTQILDQKMSDMIRAKDLAEKMAERVQTLSQKVKERSVGEKLGGTIANIIDAASLGSLKGFVSKFIPRNLGLKTLNSLDLEAGLSKALSTIDKLNAKIEEASAAKPQPKPTFKGTAKAVTKTLKSAAKADALTQRNQ